MRTICRIFAVAVLFALGATASARSRTLSDFIEKVSGSLVSFDYAYSMPSGKTKMTGSGQVRVLGSSFRMEGNGLEIWCDGKTRWTVDRISEEALVEYVDDSGDSFSTNPALMISSVDDTFNEISFGASKFGGKAVDASVLSPKSKGKGSKDLVGLKLFFKSGTRTLVGARVELNDGTVSDFTISNIRFEDVNAQKESFRFDEKTLGSSYVVTDLR